MDEVKRIREIADGFAGMGHTGTADCLREIADALDGRVMPEGMEWPTVDGEPVDFKTGYEPSLGVLEAVSIYSNGACEVMSHDGIIKGISEIHIAKTQGTFPNKLTHEAPDSWGSVWMDVSNGGETPLGMMRRCRALAERGE